MRIGKNVIYLREMYEMSQLELAEKLGINKSTLSRIEADTRDVKGDELVKIADYFDVSTDFLLGRRESSFLKVRARPKSSGKVDAAYSRAPEAIKEIVDAALKPYIKEKEAPSEKEAVS